MSASTDTTVNSSSNTSSSSGNLRGRKLKSVPASDPEAFSSPMKTSSTASMIARLAHGKIGTEQQLYALDSSYHTSEESDSTVSIFQLSTQDKLSMSLLLLLYTLQGIPMGLSASIPLILKEQNSSYEALSLFSLVSVPFSLKLLWAPFVDSYYSRWFGRRKTWLVPVQMLTGLIMVFGTDLLDNWIGQSPSSSGSSGDYEEKSGPNVADLTAFFLLLYFLMATQDIAVDGWALTMLSKESVGYASICNSIGQVLGVFLANQGFIALSDSRWCRTYLGLDNALITLAEFMQFWGYVFLVTTLGLWVFKKEEDVSDDEHPEGLIDTIKQVISIFKLRSVQVLAVVLLTCRVAFAPTDAAFTFKLQEYGMPKSDIATISPILLLVSLALPAVASSWVSSQPLNVMLLSVPMKLAASVGMWSALGYTADFYPDGADQISSTPPVKFLAPLVLLLVVNEIASTLMFISFMAFFNKVSDPTIGGSYMTLLNTMSNLGSKWPTSLSLYLMPKMTFSVCKTASAVMEPFHDSCTSASGLQCTAEGGTCALQWDGYTVQMGICLLLGLMWLLLARAPVQRLQSNSSIDWYVSKQRKMASQ